MFSKQDTLDRALGAMGALGVLVVGIFVTGAFASPPARVTTAEATHAVELTQRASATLDYVC